jgi:hypothetical protein
VSVPGGTTGSVSGFSLSEYSEGINNSGEVVGFYGKEGFRYSNGVYTTLSVPGGAYTYPASINDSGEVVGYYDNGSAQEGFIAVESVTIASGETFQISGPSADAVTFSGNAGALQLDQSKSFSGTVSGFGGQDQIDLSDIAFGPNTTLGYAANNGNTGGTLTVSDGTHVGNIALLGQYVASSFATASDGHGGTMITDPVAVAQNQLTLPHA